MLHFALTTLLAMQSASASPNTVPSGSAGEAPVSAPGDAPSTPEPRAATAPPARSTPTPGPRTSPTPGPRAPVDFLAVVNKSDNTVSILDGSTGKLRSSVPVEPGPHEVEILADGKTAAVSSYGSKAQPGRFVSLIDLATAKIDSRVDTGEGSRPHGMKALADGRLLVTAEGTRELLIVDPKGAKVVARIPTGRDLTHMVTAAPDGKRAYVSSLTPGSVTVIDLVTGKVVKDIPTGKGAEGIDMSPDGREVWVANREANTITVIDVKSLMAVFTIKASEFPIRVRLTPDGRRAVVTFTGSGDVGVFDAATRIESKRIPIGRDAVAGAENRVFQKRFGSSPAPVGLLITPDGKRAFVSAGHADVVAVVDLEKLRVDDAWTAGKEPDGLAGRFNPKPVEGVRPTAVAPMPAPARRMVTARPPG